MNSFGKITLINLAILLAYSILMRLAGSSAGQAGSWSILIYSMILIAMHVFANLFLTIYYYSHKRNDMGGAFLANIFIVLIVGFGVCYGNANF